MFADRPLKAISRRAVECIELVLSGRCLGVLCLRHAPQDALRDAKLDTFGEALRNVRQRCIPNASRYASQDAVCRASCRRRYHLQTAPGTKLLTTGVKINQIYSCRCILFPSVSKVELSVCRRNLYVLKTTSLFLAYTCIMNTIDYEI